MMRSVFTIWLGAILLVLLGCDPRKPVEDAGDVEKDQPVNKKTTEEDTRPRTVTEVVRSLASALEGMSNKYPELAQYKTKEALTGPTSLHHVFRFARPTTKRGILPSDFGEHGCRIRFVCAPPPRPNPSGGISAREGPRYRLKNLGLEVWADVRVSQNPSGDFVRDVQALLRSHVALLEMLDKEAGNG